MDDTRIKRKQTTPKPKRRAARPTEKAVDEVALLAVSDLASVSGGGGAPSPSAYGTFGADHKFHRYPPNYNFGKALLHVLPMIPIVGSIAMPLIEGKRGGGAAAAIFKGLAADAVSLVPGGAGVAAKVAIGVTKLGVKEAIKKS